LIEQVNLSRAFFIAEHLVIVNLRVECPKILTRLPLPRVFQMVASPQRWTSPRVLKVRETLSTSRPLRPLQLPSPRVMMLRMIPQGQSLLSTLKCPCGALGPMDSEPVDHNQMKAHPCLDQENNRDHIRTLQSLMGQSRLHSGQISHQSVCNSVREHRS
jgi:hypothetical protein